MNSFKPIFRTISLIIIYIFLGSSNIVSLQSKAEKIISKNLEAIGGIEKLQSIKTVYSKSKAIDIDYSTITKIVSNEKSMLSYYIPDKPITHVVYQNNSLQICSGGKLANGYDEEMIKMMKETTNIFYLNNYKERGWVYTFNKSKSKDKYYTLDGINTHNNEKETLYINKETYLIDGVKSEFGIMTYKDYQATNGILYPRLYSVEGGIDSFSGRIVELKFNIEYTEEDFDLKKICKKPASKI